jgi:hypothetical protein
MPDMRGWGLHDVFAESRKVGEGSITFRSGRARGQFHISRGGLLRAGYRHWAGSPRGTWVNIRLAIGDA